MSWLTAKFAAKKAWLWCKHHWKIIAVAVWTLVVWFISRKNASALQGVLAATVDSYKKEVEILENSHNSELEKRNETIVAHNKALDQLEEKYAGSSNDLTTKKRSRYLELLALYDEDPENINKILEEEFGFNYVE
tara:strand:- start:242 stop:646 length:405 start_codon:yes stop_codon:yes gene_type:complete